MNCSRSQLKKMRKTGVNPSQFLEMGPPYLPLRLGSAGFDQREMAKVKAPPTRGVGEKSTAYWAKRGPPVTAKNTSVGTPSPGSSCPP